MTNVIINPQSTQPETSIFSTTGLIRLRLSAGASEQGEKARVASPGAEWAA